MAHLVLLEDDLILASQLEEVLKSEGFSVQAFTSVNGVFEYLEEAQVDLIIADIFIKNTEGAILDGGVTLISTIKQIKGSHIPVIAISGAFAESDLLHDSSALMRGTASTVGATALLAKPFSPVELLDLIDTCLKKTAKNI